VNVPAPSAQELLDIAITLASETAELIRVGRAQAHVTGTKSALVDIVTQMDVAAEEHLRTRLAQLRPLDGVLGEEGADVHSESGVTWIVDPIDGTVNYLYGLPHFAVSVAAVWGPPRPGEFTALAGAVADGTGTVWSAGKGLGAWRDKERLNRSGGPDLAGTLLATGFQYIADRRRVQGQIVAQLLPQVRDIRRLGACSVDLCLVAAGDVDAYYEHGLNAWDYAAGAHICEEAGVKVAGAHGAAPDPHLLIAAVPEVWDALHDAILEAGGDHPWDTPSV
jgi:myo-inositol-1(or 4)-monophosphatase